MLRRDLRRSREGGDRARHPRHAGTTAPRERQPVDRSVEQLGRRSRPPRLRSLERRSRRDDTLAHGRGWLAGWRRELGCAGSRHRDDQIEAVEQGTRQPFAVRREPCRRARAGERRVATAAARAQVHGPDEPEPRRERSHDHRRARPTRSRPPAAAAAPRARSAGTRAARRGAARRGARGSPLRGAGSRRHRRPPRQRHRDAGRETAASRAAAAPVPAGPRQSGSASPRAPPRG